MRVATRCLTLAAMLLSFAGMAGAAEIRVLSIAAVEAVLQTLAPAFHKETGHQVILTFASPELVMDKIKANEIHDAVIVSEPAMDALDRDGIVNPESRVRLAKASPADAAPAGSALQLTYEGALMSDGSVPLAAREFIRFLATAEARDAWLAAKLEPLSEN